MLVRACYTLVGLISVHDIVLMTILVTRPSPISTAQEPLSNYTVILNTSATKEVNFNQDLLLECVGTRPLIWYFINTTVAEFSTTEKDCKLYLEEDRASKTYPFCLQLKVPNAQYYNTGKYVCAYSNSSDEDLRHIKTSVYVYVYDPSHPFLIQEKRYYSVSPTQTFILPCLTTSPSLNVTLWKKSPLTEITEDMVNMTFEHSVGFTIHNSPERFDGEFFCKTSGGSFDFWIQYLAADPPVITNVVEPFLVFASLLGTWELTCEGRQELVWELPIQLRTRTDLSKKISIESEINEENVFVSTLSILVEEALIAGLYTCRYLNSTRNSFSNVNSDSVFVFLYDKEILNKIDPPPVLIPMSSVTENVEVKRHGITYITQCLSPVRGLNVTFSRLNHEKYWWYDPVRGIAIDTTKNILLDISGPFCCSAKFKEIREEFCGNLTYEPDIDYPLPEIVSSRSSPLLVGSEVTLTCTVFSSSELNLTWSHPDLPVNKTLIFTIVRHWRTGICQDIPFEPKRYRAVNRDTYFLPTLYLPAKLLRSPSRYRKTQDHQEEQGFFLEDFLSIYLSGPLQANHGFLEVDAVSEGITFSEKSRASESDVQVVDKRSYGAEYKVVLNIKNLQMSDRGIYTCQYQSHVDNYQRNVYYLDILEFTWVNLEPFAHHYGNSFLRPLLQEKHDKLFAVASPSGTKFEFSVRITSPQPRHRIKAAWTDMNERFLHYDQNLDIFNEGVWSNLTIEDMSQKFRSPLFILSAKVGEDIYSLSFLQLFQDEEQLIWIQANTVTPQYGQELILECLAHSNTFESPVWYFEKNGELLSLEELQTRTPGRSKVVLSLAKVSHEDSGVYMCKAKFKYAAHWNVYHNKTISVRVMGNELLSRINNTLYISLGLGISFLLVLLGGIFFFRYKFKSRSNGPTPSKKESFRKVSQPDECNIPFDTNWEFPLNRITMGPKIGQGAFGKVVKAEAVGIKEEESVTTVAVKMLKPGADQVQQRALLGELKILILLGRHVNIVNLLGAVTKYTNVKGDLFVIVEYCSLGSLRQFLLRHKKRFVNQLDPQTGKVNPEITTVAEWRPEDSCEHNKLSGRGGLDTQTQTTYVTMSVKHGIGESISATDSGAGHPGTQKQCIVQEDREDDVLTTSDLLAFAFQCSRGMEYLASRKLVHRDLATRNILLTSDFIIKICDFGLTKRVDYLYNKRSRKNISMPIRWMAPEAIGQNDFTVKSDVWSFGVVLWEMFSLGVTPYPGLDIDGKFYRNLLDGYRLDRPGFASQEIYSIMKECWNHESVSRPDFIQLSEKLGLLIVSSTRQYYLDLNEPYEEQNSRDPNYQKLGQILETSVERGDDLGDLCGVQPLEHIEGQEEDGDLINEEEPSSSNSEFSQEGNEGEKELIHPDDQSDRQMKRKSSSSKENAGFEPCDVKTEKEDEPVTTTIELEGLERQVYRC